MDIKVTVKEKISSMDIYPTFQLKNSFVRIIDYVIFRSVDIFLIKIDHSS